MRALSLYFSAIKVAAVVGSLLLLINQYDAIFGSGDVRVLPALLTYCVPFVVFIAGQKNALSPRGFNPREK
ncbi:MAG: nitrate/nitrite transporter NrtS [Pseudomonadales bacterium]|nr:nitrate/nitrite transporter NrtS [Pseudomonadales bacterium]